MNFAIRFAAETEMYMNAIERIKEYIGVPNETYAGKKLHNYSSQNKTFINTPDSFAIPILFLFCFLLCNLPDTQGLKATSRCGLQLFFSAAVATYS